MCQTGTSLKWEHNPWERTLKCGAGGIGIVSCFGLGAHRFGHSHPTIYILARFLGPWQYSTIGKFGLETMGQVVYVISLSCHCNNIIGAGGAMFSKCGVQGMIVVGIGRWRVGVGPIHFAHSQIWVPWLIQISASVMAPKYSQHHCVVMNSIFVMPWRLDKSSIRNASPVHCGWSHWSKLNWKWVSILSKKSHKWVR